MAEETEWTTITVPKPVKQDLDEQRGSTPWGAFLEELRKEHADPLTLNDAEEIARVVSEEMDTADINAEQVAKEVSRRFDYAKVVNEVANEVEERLR